MNLKMLRQCRLIVLIKLIASSVFNLNNTAPVLHNEVMPQFNNLNKTSLISQ